MKKTILLLALLSVIVILTSCTTAEEVVVTKYFMAMQGNDKDTMSTMALEPRDLEFTSYELLSIDEPTKIELELPGLIKKTAELETKKKAQVNIAMDKKFDLEDKEDELEDTRRVSKRAQLKKEIETLKEESGLEMQKVLGLQMEINTTKKKIDNEKALITLSTGMRENLEMFSGETQTTKATVKVTLQNGDVKDYLFLLRRDILTLEDKESKGRVIIIKLMSDEEYKKAQDEEKNPPVPEVTTEEVDEKAPATEEEKKDG
ncbi:MAG: hypothetical protein GY757_57525 [bacterium]|nr:hypothetical protein [bacterium]